MSTSEGTDSSGDELRDDEDEDAAPRPGPHSLPYDVVRRFAQPLGIHLDEWESRIINTDKGVVRLIPVRDRGKQLFGDAGAGVLADELETAAAYNPQLSLFPEAAPAVHGRTRRRGAAGEMDDLDASPNATTLDRIHAAMLLQGSGRTQALRPCCRLSRSAGRTSCASPTPCPRCTRAAVTRSGSSTRCCWPRGSVPVMDATDGGPLTDEDELLKRITVRSDIFGGKPIIRDMRFAVEHVLGQLAAGDTVEDILDQYELLEPEDIQACLVFAYRSIAGTCVYDRILVH